MLNRREFVRLAAALGVSATWTGTPRPSLIRWRERRDLFPEGVASGDPQADSVILWTRYPGSDPTPQILTLEVATDAGFKRMIATSRVTIRPDTDWTTRVLVGGLKPATVYYYRFTNGNGDGSRIGRTLTAPADDDPRPVRFAFVSCQNANLGAQHAYRRMISEDRKAGPGDQLGFVLHLGDFIYELVWYPEDRADYYDRKVRDLVRYPNGEKIADFHVPTTVEDYRAVYRAYLHDPDLQDARAYFPFVPMWDNHEFSWLGWQAIQQFGQVNRPAQIQKVAANRAWFEYQPARIAQTGGVGGKAALERFFAPRVVNTPVDRFDQSGLGQEPNNLAAIGSLKGYRALRFGRNVELIITDQHSYRSEDPSLRTEVINLSSPDWPGLVPEDVLAILDGGREWNGGRPPETIRFGDQEIANFRKDQPPQTILGSEQREWFLARLKASRAVWKVWGNSLGTLDWRADPQHLPAGTGTPWPAGYACFGGGDYGTAYQERSRIYDFIRREGITGFATVSGDRHSFWAGVAAKSLPPRPFEPVGIAFVTGSISAPGIVEGHEHRLPADHPLRYLYLVDRGPGESPDPTINLLMQHGVRSCEVYRDTRDLEKARDAGNPELAPHLAFLDMGGHGYATVRVTPDAFESEFVCIPRPVERDTREDGGPLRYRVRHRAGLWKRGELPVLEREVVEGTPPLT